MRTLLYQVDDFTSRRFAGYPEAVMLLNDPPEGALLQAVAAERNLAETALLVPDGGDYRLRVVHAQGGGTPFAATRPWPAKRSS